MSMPPRSVEPLTSAELGSKSSLSARGGEAVLREPLGLEASLRSKRVDRQPLSSGAGLVRIDPHRLCSEFPAWWSQLKLQIPP